jgi:hypothetical protein
VCADWDVTLKDEQFDEFLEEQMDVPYPANYASRSFRGGVHAVWLFEAPIICHGRKPMEKFLKMLASELGLNTLIKGWDDKAFLKLGNYYTHGHDWREVQPEARIPSIALHCWQYETSQARDFEDGPVIPLEDVKVAIDEKYPEWEKKWDGAFTPNSRGPRFWDESADNPTAAVLRPTGFQCFTGVKPFVSWSDLLGRGFVREYEVGRIGAAVEKYWFDGRNYFIEDEAGSFFVNNKEDTLLDIQGRHGLTNRPRRDDPLSEAKRAMFQINTAKRVEAGIPFAFTKSKIVVHGGHRYFNTARVRPLTPFDTAVKWGEGFPTISEWMEQMLGKKQLKYELAWLAYAYQNALKGYPQRGQCHFLCGPPNSGKTLYNKCVLGDLFGGGIKASEYLCGKNDWTDYLFEYGMWLVDDEAPSESRGMHTAFTAKLKEHVANDTFLITGKFKKSGRAFWRGRISITLNDDPVSMRLLPDLDMSIKDKLIILKCAAGYEFEVDTREKIEAELPYFARWLVDHEIPANLRDIRFGVKAYVNPELESVAKAGSRYSNIAELLDIYRQTLGDDHWEGTCSGLLMALGGNEHNRILLKDINVYNLGRGLNHMKSIGASWLTKPQQREWRIEGK